MKRRNPFANIENTFSSPAKKVFIYTDDDDADSSDSVKPDGSAGVEGEKSTTRTLPFSERLLQAEELSKDVPSKKPTSLSEDDSLFEDEDLFQERTPILKSPQAGAVTSIAPPACVEYPADWSLKTRLLFTSLLPFSWAVQPRATEEAQGLTQHCRGQYTTIPQSIQVSESVLPVQSIEGQAMSIFLCVFLPVHCSFQSLRTGWKQQHHCTTHPNHQGAQRGHEGWRY